MLKSQDIVILVKLLSKLSLPKREREGLLSQNKLAIALCMSASEVNAGLGRLVESGLLGEVEKNDVDSPSTRKRMLVPIRSACEECLISGVKYFFPAKLGGYVRGIATSYAAPIFSEKIILGQDPIPVWPYAEGDKRGLALAPLYPSVPQAIAQDPDDTLFYEILTLIDAIRTGRARERNIAIQLLKEKINYEQ